MVVLSLLYFNVYRSKMANLSIPSIFLEILPSVTANGLGITALKDAYLA